MSEMQTTLDALLRTSVHFFLKAAFPVMQAGAALGAAPFLEAMCRRMHGWVKARSGGGG